MSSPLEAVLRRDRAIVLAGVIVIAGLGWAYLISMAGMEEMMAPALTGWTTADFLAMFTMWAVMMVAMMLPSAAPLLLLHARLERANRERGALDRADRPVRRRLPDRLDRLQRGRYRCSSGGSSAPRSCLRRWWRRTPYLGAAFLSAPASISSRRSSGPAFPTAARPIDFVMHHWRRGYAGALRMGLEHGLYCIGCCWFLMGLLFVGGVMNLLWIAALSIFVLLEKVAPRSEMVTFAAGCAAGHLRGVDGRRRGDESVTMNLTDPASAR